VDIWKEIHPEFDTSHFSEMTLEDMMQSLKTGKASTGLGAISITDARERIIDFSLPYFETGLAIASRTNDINSLSYYLSTISQIFKALIPWILLLCIVGILVWIFEKKTNRDEFDEPLAKGIGSGIWWACVTMTTVGYGDKTPKSFLGRILGVFWMFSGIILISSLTATITSTMTLDQLSAQVNSIEDLKNKNVGVIQVSSSKEFLAREGVSSKSFDTLEIALNALNNHEIDYLVHDRPIMQYIISQNGFEMITVLDMTLNREFYGFPVKDNSPLTEQLNIGILRAIQSGKVAQIIKRYI